MKALKMGERMKQTMAMEITNIVRVQNSTETIVYKARILIM